MDLRKRIAAMALVIADEAERNSAFRRRLGEALGLSDALLPLEDSMMRVKGHDGLKCPTATGRGVDERPPSSTRSSWQDRARACCARNLHRWTSSSSRMWSPSTEWIPAN